MYGPPALAKETNGV